MKIANTLYAHILSIFFNSIRFLFNELNKKLTPSHTQGILVMVPYSGIGDLIHHLSTIHSLAAKEKSSLTLLTKPRALASDIVGCDPAINNIITMDRHPGKYSGIIGFFRLIKLLRKYHFDKVYILHKSSTYALATLFAGIPKRIAYGEKRQWLFLTQYAWSGKPTKQLTEKKSATFLSLIDITLIEKEPILLVDSRSIEEICPAYQNSPKPWVCLGIGSSESYKIWREVYFSDLIQKIGSTWKGSFFLMGGPMNNERAQNISKRLSCDFFIFNTTNIPLRNNIALISQCDYFIGNDSGLLNIAAALQKISIGLFGATPPLIHSTYIRPVLPSAPKLKMNGITVDDVLSKFSDAFLTAPISTVVKAEA